MGGFTREGFTRAIASESESKRQYGGLEGTASSGAPPRRAPDRTPPAKFLPCLRKPPPESGRTDRKRTNVPRIPGRFPECLQNPRGSRTQQNLHSRWRASVESSATRPAARPRIPVSRTGASQSPSDKKECS